MFWHFFYHDIKGLKLWIVFHVFAIHVKSQMYMLNFNFLAYSQKYHELNFCDKGMKISLNSGLVIFFYFIIINFQY